MRKRNARNQELPPRCEYLPSGSVRFRPQGAKPVIIGTKHNSLQEIRAEYERITTNLEINSLEYVAEEWYQSHNFQTLKPRTQHDYKEECSKRPIKAFKGWDVSQIEPSDINRYMQARGKESIRRANLELVWLRHVLSQAVASGYINANPCRDIKPLRQPHRERKKYVTDYSYKGMYAVSNAATRVAMEISYCTGIRQGDVLKMKWSDIEKFVYIKEGKTDREYNKEISPRLLAALDAAKKLPGHPFGGWVVRNSKGGQYTSKGFQANWKRGKERMSEHRKFTFHDIRKKAITDSQGDKQVFSMHRDAKMLGVYDLEIPLSPSH